jgi:hypothetical protein
LYSSTGKKIKYRSFIVDIGKTQPTHPPEEEAEEPGLDRPELAEEKQSSRVFDPAGVV